jgi:pyruvate dehydrogenase E2 component (dihydrolipoamide acetyltransferase)
VTDFTLPELGENIETGDVLRVLVKPGDVLTKDQPVLELETDKATIEVPSSVAGQVKEIKVKAGDKIKVGQAILSVEGGDGASATAAPSSKETAESSTAPEPETPPTAAAPVEKAPPAKTEAKAAPEEEAKAAPEKAPPAKTDAKTPPKEEAKTPPEEEAKVPREEEDTRPVVSPSQKVVDINRGARQPAESVAQDDLPVAPASPSVRRMAREIGVDIAQVAGSGPGGRISIDDVKAHTKRLVTEVAGRSGVAASSEPLPDFTRWGGVDRQPMRAVRRKTAEHLSVAWATIPHVTQNDLADITSLEEMRKRYSKQVEAAGGNLTVTAIAVKIVAAALKAFPQFNSSIDLAANEIIYKKFINIGVAVDTDRGLLVPVIRDADTKSITQLSIELSQLSEKARNRKIALDEMQGGCFSISNLGGIGGSFFTPIVNAPEVAILGISRARMEPVYNKDTSAFVPRLMLPLSLSYDHRVIDGADGIRFLRWVVEAFEQPFVLALHG